MTKKLKQALIDQKLMTKPENQLIAGILGIPLGGQKRVEVPGRNSYVYVRLRSNQSEVIQAYNNKVSASYGLPVLVERDGNRYVIASLDTKRYDNNWNSQSPFLPIHGHTHSFDVEGGGGGDPVWVQSRQFTPLLSLPSGSAGAGGVVIDSYILENQDGSWKYVGGTGSPNISMHRPSSPTGAIMALVYLDSQTGNPQIIVNSGTVFPNSITGSSQLVSYIPSLPSPTSQIPLAAIRLISGTNQLSWDNIYDVRQWLHVTPSGSAGGAGSINTGVLDQRYLRLNASNDPVTDNLEVKITSNAENLTLTQHIPTGTSSTSPALKIPRTMSGSASFLQYAIYILDHTAPGLPTGTFSGGTLVHQTETASRIGINPYATGTVPVAFFDSEKNIPSGTGRLLSLRNQGIEKAWIDGFGNMNISSGTYNVGGFPHSHGGMEIIQDINLLSGDLPSFDFTNIPSGYRILKVFLCARTDRAAPATNDQLKIKINNDTGNNYVGYLQWRGGFTEQPTAGAPPVFSWVSATSSPASWFSNAEMTFYNYLSTGTVKSMQSRGFDPETNSAGAYFIYDSGVTYLLNDPITRITIYPGLGANFKQFSRAILCGV